MFDFRLKVFHTVAKRLNFTKAAEALYISQPAVSKHIQEIEQHYKTKLFERNGSKVKLTKAGNILLAAADEIFGIYRKLNFELNTLNHQKSGELRIGASTTAAQYILPPVLAAFHKEYPEIIVTMKIGNTEDIEQALEEQHIDFGITEGKSKNKSLKYIDFIEDELVLTANYDHPFARREFIQPEELLTVPILLREPGSGTLEVIAHALKGAGIKMASLQQEMQLGSTESIKSYLYHSNCVAFLSVYSILKELKYNTFSIIDVKDLRIERKFYFIQPHGESEGLSELFIQFAQRYNFR